MQYLAGENVPATARQNLDPCRWARPWWIVRWTPARGVRQSSPARLEKRGGTIVSARARRDLPRIAALASILLVNQVVVSGSEWNLEFCNRIEAAHNKSFFKRSPALRKP